MAERELPKLETGVRFPSSAPVSAPAPELGGRVLTACGGDSSTKSPPKICDVYPGIECSQQAASYKEAKEFDGRLIGLQVVEKLCSIGGPNKHLHATGYEDINCDNSSTKVWDSAINFIKAHL